MAKRGRPRKSAEEHYANGTYKPGRHGPMAFAVPEYPPGIGDPPDELGETAKKEWARVAALTAFAGVVTHADRALLAMYCAAWGRWLKANMMVSARGELVKDEVTGAIRPNPYLRVANQAAGEVATFGAGLGLSPASRAKTKIVKAPTAAESGPKVHSRRPTRFDSMPPP